MLGMDASLPDLFVLAGGDEASLVGYGQEVGADVLVRQGCVDSVAFGVGGDRVPFSFLPFTLVGGVVQLRAFQWRSRFERAGDLSAVAGELFEFGQRSAGAQDRVG